MATINIVIDYATKDKESPAKVAYIGYDFGKAKEVMGETSASSLRRELYRGGMPYMYRSHQSAAVAPTQEPVKATRKSAAVAPEPEPSPELEA